MDSTRTTWTRWGRGAAALALALLSAGCGGGSDGDTGPAGPPGPGPGPTPPDAILEAFEVPPGVRIEVLDVQGGTGPGGNALPGDVLTVLFRVTDDEGTDWDVKLMTRGEILVSGPTTNYQRVITAKTDLVAAAVDQGGGVWSYTFASPLPATYAAPINDSPSFGPPDGEMKGDPLDDGTYTVGLRLYREYEIEEEPGETVRDPAGAVYDFLVGGATVIEPRLVVADDNCNVCHTEVRGHGGGRVGVRYCLLCHTSGAEDKNLAEPAEGTPGVSVDFRVMIHRIHAASHLPSVVGISVNPDGSRNYTATPKPLEYVGFSNEPEDFSDIAFPVWPSFSIDARHDKGYSALSNTDPDNSGPLLSPRGREQATLRGPLACAKCHGDPDGDGDATAPDQGHRAWDNPSRRACGSCHDDLDFEQVYKVNTDTGMPPGLSDNTCTTCHPASGLPLSVESAHLHPLLDPAVNPGLKIAVTDLQEAGTNDGDDTIDPGERIQVTLGITNDLGVPIADPAATLDSTTVAIAGPTWNYSIVLFNQPLPVGLLTSATPTFLLPETIPLAYLSNPGPATAGVDTFFAPRAPILTVTGATPSVWERTATSGGSTTLTAAASARQNFLDVASNASFLKDDYVVIDDGVGGSEEYVRVSRVDGTRLWVAPVLRGNHAAAATVKEVTLTPRSAGVNFNVNGPLGQIVEIGATGFGTGNKVVMTYVSEFVMPSAYLPPFNDSPTLGQDVGEWTGLPIVAGTYTLDVWGYDNRSVTVPGGIPGDQYTVRGTSSAGLRDFLVGDADTLEPYDVISEPANCYTCHNDLYFHGGGRRSLVTCLVCHGAAGPEYPNPTSSATTPRVSVSFRQMIHMIHARGELENPYPFGTEGFEFPAWPGGVKQCARCHGGDAWTQPQDRSHPAGTVPARVYHFVCGSCHDDDAAHAHMDVNTSAAGYEACAVCHGPGKDLAVEKVHVVR